MLFFLVLFSSSLKPIFLVSGFGLSPIYGTITQPDLYPECPANFNKILIRSSTTTNKNLIENNHDCIAKLLRVQLNPTTGKVEELPGIITDSSPIGDPSILSSTFNSITTQAKSIGYVDNETIFSVGYNYYLHPITSYSVYDKLKEKIEELYKKNQEKSILISFDQGSSFISLFLSNYSTKEWCEKFIDSTIFISPSFAGLPLFSQLYEQEISPYKSTDEFKKTIMRMPGLHMMLPNYVVFENFTVIYNLYKDFDQHNASFSFEFLKSQGKVDDESEEIFKANVEKILKKPIPEPPVPSLIIYNDNIKMDVSYSIYQHQNKIVKSIYQDPSDGSVTSEGAQYACGHWKSAKCLNLMDSSIHMKTLTNSKTIQAVLEFIKSDNKVIENKLGFYLVSGFNGSPLYGTVTDPNKATMCPSNLKNYLFYSTYFTNVNQLVDSDAKYWISNECKAMLTRVELSDDETHVNFAPGIRVTNSKFGEYDRLTGFTGIIQRAFIEGWTHYRDLFGIGYNFMLHPLMSDETFEELKINVEKHFVETGKKSVLAGLSQGTNFVEIFITDYVTPEWARKYIAGVIFYAPAFAGWGAYDRSVTGNYGGGFPDTNIEMKKSTMRMPGLHIMMPNEVVYGNKTVIKDFPNKGDESNASFVAPLLKKLGRMDDTSYKIFKLTDKYRKYPLPNPPVPSLIIFNDGKVNADGYIYIEAKNTVSQFKDAGDGTVSADGSHYACSHWENASCFNFKSAYITHSNIQTNLITHDLTFNFIERIQYYKPYPTDKTVLNEVIKDIYTDSSYISTYRIPNNQFTYFANEGFSKYPLSYAFDNNPKTYYISSVSNNISYHNNITFEFEDVITIEAIIYGTIYHSIHNDVRNYVGFPSVLNAYTSIGDTDFQLKTVFIGTPTIPSDRIQFVFNEPVKCDKLKLEFAEVTTQKTVGYSRNPAISNMIFIRYSNDDVLSIKNAEGDFADNQYVNSHSISEYEVIADNGCENYPLSNLFDGKEDSFWISSTSNSETYHNFMTINFNEMVSLESILYDPFYDTSESTSTFYGFPTMLNVYVYINDGQKFTLNATLKGNPVYPWTRIQFPFKYNLVCKKLKLEFVTVTPQKINGLNQNPACAGLFFIGHVLPKATTSIFNPTSILEFDQTSIPDQINPTSTSDQINPTSIPDQINPTSTSNQFKPTSIEASIIQTTSIDDININDADDRSSKEWNVMILAYCIIPIFVVVIIVFIVIKIKMRKKIYNMDQNRNIY